MSHDFRLEELLADCIAGLIAGSRHAAIGASSPIPAAAAMLARERGNGWPYVSLLGSRRQSFFTDGGRGRFRLASIHPGNTPSEIIANTGFEFDAPDHVPATAAPSPEALYILRTTVAPQLAEVYPQFVASVFDAAAG